jgi:pyruvate-formate lyase-activating enzyme
MRTTSNGVDASTSSASRPANQGLFVQPEVLTILGTYKCTAACTNCCFDSNPFLTERLSLPEILTFIREGAQYPRCKMVAFSGGECFLLGDDLRSAIEYATSLGLSTRCVTNGYWAKQLAHGRRRLKPLVEAGLQELNISTGDYHQRWVTQETVINAACLSVELGLATVVVVEMQKERRVTGAQLMADPRIARLLAEHEDLFRLLESPWMPMNPDEIIEQADDQVLSRRTLHMRGGCKSVLKTIVVTPHRRMGYCCGLTREKIPELNVPWDGSRLDELLGAGSNDFMKIWLYVDGPDRILAWAATKDARIDWEGRYGHHCQTCLVVFSNPLVREAIREHYRERVDDVLARYVLMLREEQWSETRALAPDAETAGAKSHALVE